MVDIGAFGSSSASIALSMLGGSVGSSAPTVGALAGFKPYVQNEPQKIADYTKQSAYQRDLTYFKTHIGKVKSVDAFVHDPQLLKFVLTAFGLQADAQYPGKVAAILNSDLSDRNSYANRLIDPRYQIFAKEFNAHKNGMSKFSDSTVINDIIAKYTTNSYEASLSNVNPALRSAAYFLRNIGKITDAYNILGDAVFRSVVTTALNLPPEIANLPVDDQRKLIMAKLDIKKLETSGAASASGIGSASSAALDVANKDAATILNDRNVLGSAQTSLQTIDERIVAIQKSYGNLAGIQDPAGQYAAEIPVQQAAAPGLVRQQGLLNAAQDATGTVSADMAQLQKLIQQVGDPKNTTPLATLKTQFQDLHDKIKAAIAGATYQFDNGTGGTTYTAQNLLDGSLSGAVTVQYNSKGDKVSVNAQNLGTSSSFQAQLDSANTAFQAVNGSFDGSNIQSASSALTGAQSVSTYVIQSVGNDAAGFSKAIASVPQWAGTYNTAQLYRGSQSLVDAGTRVTQINQVLTQIQQVATQSSQLDPAADRTSLQKQYNDLITQLGGLINKAGQPGLDNLLAANPNAATPGYYSYSIDQAGKYDMQAQTHDLVASVLNPLTGGDVSSLTSANAVIAMVTGSVSTAMSGASQQVGIDSKTFSLPANTIDPRSAVDSQYRKLAADMPQMVKDAGWLKDNLLDPHQSPIVLNATTAGMSIVITPQTTYDTDVTQVLKAGAQALPSTPNDTSGALAQLETARFNNARAMSSIRQQIVQVELAKSITQTHITVIQKQQQQANGSSFTPLNATPYAVQLVQKYLAAVDAKASGLGSFGASNSYIVQLLQHA